MSNDKPKKEDETFNFRAEDKPYYVISKNEILNKDVDWQAVLLSVLEHTNKSLETIAKKCETSQECLQKILNNDYSELRFRSGSCLITLQMIFVGE